MNFLAHLFLSGKNEDLLIGNFIADSVRKSQWGSFKPEVIEGIKLHHKIDFFTDNHNVVERSKVRLRKKHGKYSPVIADILYDHFLAANFQDYSQTELGMYATYCYSTFRKRWNELPKAIQRMIPYMERGNWLYNYGNREGLSSVMNGMSRRASFKNSMDEAVNDMFNNYEEYEDEFKTFFPLLQDYVSKIILNGDHR